MNYVEAHINANNTEFTQIEGKYSIAMHMKGRLGMESTTKIANAPTVYQKIIEEVKYRLRFKEEQEFGKALTDFNFERYIAAKIHKHIPKCLGCPSEKLILVNTLHCFVVCDACGMEYSEAIYYRELHKFAQVMNEHELLKAKYDYGRISHNERKVLEKDLVEKIKQIS